MTRVTEFYEKDYSEAGFGAQRRFPNEELSRFMGRNFFGLSRSARADTQILEVGSGSGGNLWMIAREGFDAHGLELSPTAVELCRRMLKDYGTKATLSVGDMCNIGYDDQTFDAVVDVFSSNCLASEPHREFLAEASRVLRPGGVFFSYFPSIKSDAFKRVPPEERLDFWTLDGIHDAKSPFCGNSYPLRFLSMEEYKSELIGVGLEVDYTEIVGRTYRNGEEYFEFLVVEARRPG